VLPTLVHNFSRLRSQESQEFEKAHELERRRKGDTLAKLKNATLAKGNE
jgi:hypothetical protein